MTDLDAATVVAYLKSKGLRFELLEHAPSGTSETSAQVRKAAIGRDVVGAKALALQVRRGTDEHVALVVLRGRDRISSRSLQRALAPRCGGRPRTSFAEPEELATLLRGLEPGRVPPLGPPLLPNVRSVLVDEALLHEREVGFNAADFGLSVIMPTGEWLKALPADVIIGDLRQEP